MTTSWKTETFDAIHARAADPWQVETSAYEQEKYAATLAALPAGQCGSILEIGCSIGAQTILLAARCTALLALDIAAEPVRRTRQRCAHLAHVTVRQAQIPRDWPDGAFDVIVISEVLYFLDAADIIATARLAAAAANAVVLVNWTGFTDTPSTGDEAAETFAASCGMARTLSEKKQNYRIDVFSRQPIRS